VSAESYVDFQNRSSPAGGMKLSIIDQSPVSSGSTPADALRNTIELARLADRLGYERYWIAEHHDIPALASPAPEVLIARLTGETQRIRLGSGGIMLPHYSSLKVAEVFRMLHALAPGRIDLGVGRAPGGGPLAAFALRRDRREGAMPDDFPEQLMEVLAFLNHEFLPQHPFSRIIVTPDMPGAPEVWMLGSSLWSASAAAEIGLPYAFAHFIAPGPAQAAIAHYYERFKPSRYLSAPRAIAAFAVICAPTDEEAVRLSASVRLVRRRIRNGEAGLVPSVDEALRELGAESVEVPGGDLSARPFFAGSPATLVAQLSMLATDWRLDEVMIVTIVHDHALRLRSYELLGRAFGLRER
jgi:luciferase family oxidoreductase group 1